MREADPDAELVAALRSGETDAARRLYDAYGVPLHGFVLRLTGDHELASEIVQDVMVRAWRAAPRFDPDRGVLRSWLYEIARNAVADAGRSRRRRPLVAVSLSEEPEATAGDAPSAEDEVDRHLRGWLIETALDRIPADHRAVLELVYLRHRTVAEAAAVLGIAEGTVKSRCFYALQNLRSAFHELGVIRGDL